jgi:hypothetical protein
VTARPAFHCDASSGLPPFMSPVHHGGRLPSSSGFAAQSLSCPGRSACPSPSGIPCPCVDRRGSGASRGIPDIPTSWAVGPARSSSFRSRAGTISLCLPRFPQPVSVMIFHGHCEESISVGLIILSRRSRRWRPSVANRYTYCRKTFPPGAQPQCDCFVFRWLQSWQRYCMDIAWMLISMG